MSDHKQGLASAVAKAARMADTTYKQANPDALSLKVRVDVAAYKPRPKELQGAPVRAVRLFLGSRTYADMSNADIAKYLSRGVPGYVAPSNLLTERFTPGEKKAVAALMSEHGQAPLDLDRDDTPSKVKRTLRARYRGDGGRKVTVTAVFSPESITINERLFPVTIANGVSRIRVGKRWMSATTLQTLLDPL